MLILERFEENTAIIENGDESMEVRREAVSPDVREGDVLFEKDGIYYSDKYATEERREKITKLQNSLWS